MNDKRRKTLVIGASENPERYSNMCLNLLHKMGFEALAVGNRAGFVGDVVIHKDMVHFDEVDTITLYINSKIQEDYYDYFLQLKPRRIIFNPGTENPILEKMAIENGIEPLNACTLVMLRLGNY
jgi:predicted CoA-binding protein